MSAHLSHLHQLIRLPAGLADGAQVYRDALLAGCKPRPQQTVSEWADSQRVLTRSASSEAGQWRTSRTPYLREPLDSLSANEAHERIVLMFGTQLGKTEVLLNWIGYVIDREPAPIMMVQPTVDMGRRISQQRLQPMIDASPALAALVSPIKSRDSGNTLRTKKFPGGLLHISGANSPGDLRSMPVRYLALDEVSLYPADLAGEGSAVEMADRRTSSFARRKILMCSTPTLADFCAIEAAFQESDQRELYVPCVACGVWDVVTDEQLTSDALYVCAHCGHLADEGTCKARWYGPDPQLEWRPRNPSSPIRGYHLSSWYAALGLGYSWEEIVGMRTRASDDPLRQKTYTNTIQGLAYRDDNGRLDPGDLEERRESWRLREVPAGCLLVTASVDVQQNRFAIALWGWGRQETAWWLDYVELPGNPVEADDWLAVADYLARPLINSYGQTVKINLVAVDSGNWTHEVYQFVRPRQQDGYLAVKGMSTGGKAVIAGRPSQVDIGGAGRGIRSGVNLWQIGTDTAKATLVARMHGDGTAEPDDRRIRIAADIPSEALAQLTAEVYDSDRRRWVRMVGRRNEALDCLVYAYAAACHPRVRVHVMRESDWARLEAELEPRTADLFATPAPQKPDVNAPPAENFIRPPQSGGPYIRGRR